MKLTVILRDDSPMIHCGDAPSYRTVVVKLTDEQAQSIQLRYTHSFDGRKYYEVISHAIVEADDVEVKLK